MQIVRKMTELEAFEVLSVVLKHPVYILQLSPKIDRVLTKFELIT